MLKWGQTKLPLTPSKLLATANLVTSQKKRKRNRKRLQYPQHEASSFSAAAFRGQEVRGKNRIGEQRVTTQDFQSPLISPDSEHTKIYRVRKRFNYIQPENLQQIIVPLMDTRFAKSTQKYHEIGSSSNSFGTKSAAMTTKSTKKQISKITAKSTKRVETTTEFEFTEESINGSTAGVTKDFNNFEIPSEQPAAMGFNLDEEFTGKINYVTAAASNERKAITANDLNNFGLMERIFKRIIVTKPPQNDIDIQNDLDGIIEANKKLAESEMKKS